MRRRDVPQRISDVLYRTTSYVDRRAGMRDNAREARKRRLADREVQGSTSDPGVATVSGTTTWDPGTINAGDDSGTSITLAGVNADGTWVCAASFSSLEELGNDQWSISGWPKNGGTCRVVIVNLSGNNHNLSGGYVSCRCWKI